MINHKKEKIKRREIAKLRLDIGITITMINSQYDGHKLKETLMLKYQQESQRGYVGMTVAGVYNNFNNCRHDRDINGDRENIQYHALPNAQL